MGLVLGLNTEVRGNDESWIASAFAQNPYSQNALGNIGNYLDSSERVTSIPSPYARMHLFDIAFRECTNLDPEEAKNEYHKCVAHCLDLFELFFYFDNEKMIENGLTVERLKLVTNEGRPILRGNVYDAHRILYNALGVFRENYRVAGKSLDYIYLLKKEDKIIAATSPFTGFFTAPDYSSQRNPIICNNFLLISDSDNLRINNRELNNLWRGYSERSDEFKQFLYMLLDSTNLKNSFNNLFRYVESLLDQDTKSYWETLDFYETFPQFNFDPTDDETFNNFGFLLNPDNRNKLPVPHVIPDKYDSLFLKFLLFQKDGINFELKESQYQPQISNRQLFGINYPWVSEGDFLSDSLVILTGEINKERYHVVAVTNSDGRDEYNVLPPLKKRYLEYFNITSIENNLIVRKLEDGSYDVTLKIPVGENGQKVTLKKIYMEGGTYPNGNVISKPFKLGFGIYPFIKTPAHITDFYKILTYYPDNYSVNLNFYRYNNDNFLDLNNNFSLLGDRTKKSQHIKKVMTHENYNDKLKLINSYYSLEGRYIVEESGDKEELAMYNHDVSFDLIEMNIQEILDAGAKNEGRIPFTGEVLIIPRFFQTNIDANANSAIVAIDLGSSNTYMAYMEDGGGQNDIIEYQSINAAIGDCEFVVLNATGGEKKKQKFDLQGELPIHQLCEFMPSYFAPEGYHFPIPTALNIRGLTKDKIIKHPKAPLSVLVDANIPFAYYEKGVRKLGPNPLDIIIDDFKWIDASNLASQEVQVLKLFMDQLILMTRTNLILRNLNLNNLKLIWTYPLSFDIDKINAYSMLWKNAYNKYFSCDNEPIIISASESRTPVFNVNAANGFNVSVDIGGGSTDVMMYQDGDISLATSFHFAGNCLYGDNDNKVEQLKNEENVFYYYIKEYLSPKKKNEDVGYCEETMVADPMGTNISALMNYCFAKPGCQVASKFLTKEIALLNMIHNSAIIFHIAQICKLQPSDEKIPAKIYFSGNGSKLLMLTKDTNNLNKRSSELLKLCKNIFTYVFTHDLTTSNEDRIIKEDYILSIEGSDGIGGMEVVIDKNPKAATAWGALKGANILNNPLMNREDIENYWVPLGDSETIYRVNQAVKGGGLDMRADLSKDKDKLSSIEQNINDFLFMYFEIIHHTHNGKDIDDKKIESIIKGKQSISRALRSELGRKDRGNYLNDSLFFSVISQIIKDLAKELNPKNN